MNLIFEKVERKDGIAGHLGDALDGLTLEGAHGAIQPANMARPSKEGLLSCGQSHPSHDFEKVLSHPIVRTSGPLTVINRP